MVSATEEVIVPTTEGLEPPHSDDTPPPASADVEIDVKGQEAAVEGQTAEPSDEEQLTSALDAIAKFDRGDSEELRITPKQRELVKSHQDRVASQEAAYQQAQENYTKHVQEIESAFETTHSGVVEDVNTLLEELGVDLTTSQAELLIRKIADRLLSPEGLKGKVTISVLTPLTASAQRSLVATYVRDLGLSEREAWARVQNRALPDLQADTYRLGFTAGRKAGPAPDSVVMTKKDYDKAITEAKKEGANAVKSGGYTGAVSGSGGGSGGTKTMAWWSGLSLEERMAERRRNSNIEAEIQ